MSSPQNVCVARVVELWRYPVKGMRGERVESQDLDAHGVQGDRRFAIRSSGAPRGKPLLSGAERAAMLLFAARGWGAETCVTSPDGEAFSIHDPRLIVLLQRHMPGGHQLSLEAADKPMTDVRPVLLMGTGSVPQLESELGMAVDGRRFRANVVLGLERGFAEDALVGRDLRIGAEARLRITERCPRCRMVTLDLDTACAEPLLMKHLDRHHDGRVGVYATVLRPGRMQAGDEVMPV